MTALQFAEVDFPQILQILYELYLLKTINEKTHAHTSNSFIFSSLLCFHVSGHKSLAVLQIMLLFKGMLFRVSFCSQMWAECREINLSVK